MSSATLVPISEYLSTSYRPDREYVDGLILERNLGEWDHSKVQARLIIYLSAVRTTEQLHVVPEQRIQVTPTRFRVPDVCLVVGPEPDEQVLTRPPFVCIEILSKDDTMTLMQERISDYLAFGVPYVWVVDPRTKRAYSYRNTGMQEIKDGVLSTTNPEIAVPLA